jgi:hypothetical protein
MFRFFQNTKRSLDSLLNLIIDLVADGLLFFRLLFRSRTALSAEVLFLRKQLVWEWKSQAGRPRIPENIRKLIVQMARRIQLGDKRAWQGSCR